MIVRRLTEDAGCKPQFCGNRAKVAAFGPSPVDHDVSGMCWGSSQSLEIAIAHLFGVSPTAPFLHEQDEPLRIELQMPPTPRTTTLPQGIGPGMARPSEISTFQCNLFKHPYEHYGNQLKHAMAECLPLIVAEF